MGQKVANIAKNTSYFTLALILQKVISFTYFTIYARQLGPADLGKYYYALSFTTIISVVMDLGIVNYFIKAASGEQEGKNNLFRSALGAKIILVLPAFLIIAAKLYFSGSDPLITALIYVAMISMIMDAFTSLFFAVSRSHHNLKYESIVAVLSQATTLIVSLYVLKNNLGLITLMWAQVASSLVSLIVALSVIHFKWKISLSPIFNFKKIKVIFALSLSFGLYAIFQRFYTYIDSVLLFQLAGDKAVGIYQVPFKITNALQFLPMAFVASLYPALSAYWKNNREQLNVTFERAMNYSTIIALPISVGIIALTEPIIALMKSGYGEAAWPMRLAAASTFFVFINYPVGALLNACDKQKINTRNMGITAVMALIFNSLLIPKLGVTGAALTLIISNALMFVLNWQASKEIINSKLKKIVRVFWQSILSSLVMFFIVFFAKEKLGLALVILVGGIAYFAMLLAFGAFKKADMISIVKSFKKS